MTLLGPDTPASQAWANGLGPLLSSSQVRGLLKVSQRRVSELLERRRLIGLTDSSVKLRFPAFQFNDARPQAPLVRAYWTLADAAVDPRTAAAWCAAPDDALDGKSPADWVLARRDPDKLATIARQEAARLAPRPA